MVELTIMRGRSTTCWPRWPLWRRRSDSSRLFTIDLLRNQVNRWCIYKSVSVQMERQKRKQMLDRHWEQLSASQRLIADQEEELTEVTKELEATEKENTRLRQSMEKILDTGHRRYWFFFLVCLVCFFAQNCKKPRWDIKPGYFAYLGWIYFEVGCTKAGQSWPGQVTLVIHSLQLTCSWPG